MTSKLTEDESDGGAREIHESQARVTYLVKRLESAVRRELDNRMQALGLTTPQYAALSILQRTPGLSSAQLARRSFVTAQSMQVMVSGFLRNGYVDRRPDPNSKRILRNYLAEPGVDALRRCEEEADAMEEHMLAGLSPLQVSLMHEAMAHCIHNLSARAT